MSSESKTGGSSLLGTDRDDLINEVTGLIAPTVLWFAVFLLLPLLVIFYYSFLTYQSFNVINEFTLSAWVDGVFGSGAVRGAFVRTIGVGIIVTIITLAFGYPLAYYLRFHTTPMVGLVLLLFLVIPFWTSELIRTFGWFPILGRNGVVNGLLMTLGITSGPIGWLLFSGFSQAVGYLQNYVVFMAAPIYISLSQIDEGLLNASETLRGNPVETFKNVTWPLSLPGVAIGCMFTFVLTIGNFTVPSFLSGGANTVPTLIFSRYSQGLNYPSAAALSITLLVVIFAFVFLLFRVVDITEIASQD
ncbi:ABC transporter permease [Natronorubrum sulfidifaciens]|uniref:Spermidine/putrescine ABC transporter permease n=1 Tax=Natronorubrum sulfidifaciens JCM 14089 TaxID=1230460 RepID=L9VVD5_9EURY|nr:ABC transporter permease [Natronorubrum sulfidifaciens]ELY40952.1 spermidine/putrescine ABC transporter permease [Natronorubrum sulfidifaciens JCM 14089]